MGVKIGARGFFAVQGNFGCLGSCHRRAFPGLYKLPKSGGLLHDALFVSSGQTLRGTILEVPCILQRRERVSHGQIYNLNTVGLFIVWSSIAAPL